MKFRFDEIVQRRLGALLLLFLECGLLIYCKEEPVLFAVPAVLSLFLVVTRIKFTTTHDMRMRLLLGLIVLCLLLWFFYLQHQPRNMGIFRNNVRLGLCTFFLFLQASLFALRHTTGMPSIFPLYGVLAIGFGSAYFENNPTFRLVYFIASGIYAFLSIAYFSTFSQKRLPRHTARHAFYPGAVFLVLLASTFLLAVGTARLLPTVERRMDRLFVKAPLQLAQVTLGKRNHSELGEISAAQLKQTHRIVLRVYSDASPGYLRGNSYAEYDGKRWRAEKDYTPCPPALPPASLNEKEPGQWYAIDSARTPDASVLEIWPDSAIQTALYAPLEIAWLNIEGPDVQSNPANIIETVTALRGAVYRIYPGTRTDIPALSEEERTLYTSLPDSLSPEIRRLAQEICHDANMPLKKVLAITNYFHKNYSYHLGIEIPKGENPLEYFLLRRPYPAAHCEYFACAAAVLLRAAGVPTRYVTGVLAWEKSAYAPYWTVRNRDAHAWVEAYIEGEGWIVVEATPATALPQEGPGSWFAGPKDVFQHLLFQFKQFWRAFAAGAWRERPAVLIQALLATLRTVFTSWLLLPLFLILGTTYFFWRTWHRRSHHIEAAIAYADMHEILLQMDRQVHKKGVTRRPEETLHAFANRLDHEAPFANATQAARWYRVYAVARYGATVTREAIARLRKQLPKV